MPEKENIKIKVQRLSRPRGAKKSHQTKRNRMRAYR